MQEECASIQSISISFPTSTTIGDAVSIRKYLKDNNLGRYFRYDETSIIMLENIVSWNKLVSVWKIIADYFLYLRELHVITACLRMEHLRVHEIKLCLVISIPDVVFCHTSGFHMTNNNVFRSNDYRQYKRGNDFWQESKGIQQSFITAIPSDTGVSLVFNFSGKYRAPITPCFMDGNYQTVINRLVTIGGVYLTQATCPEYFDVAKGYVPFLPEPFRTMLSNANWFDGNFKKKYLTDKILRGALL
jgi:hypothetical protein